MPEKDATYWKVLDAAIALDFRKGHLRWTISDLSRASGITRSLVYYYFSNDKQEILKDAVRVIGHEFLGLNDNPNSLWKLSNMSELVLITRRQLQQSPHIGAFYLANRNKDTDTGTMLKDLEQEFFEKLRTQFPKATKPQLEALFGLLFGLIFAPDISNSSVVLAVEAAVALLRTVKK